MKDKMITFVDLYRKQYNEPIKDIKYDKECPNNNKMIITFILEKIKINFESEETFGVKWINLNVEIEDGDKIAFDDKYDFIVKTVQGLK